MQRNRKHPIHSLIEQGEHLRLDFKFEVSDAAKIARSLVAFANTEGGTLLIGVKDNGSIAGIRTEEEYYMIDQAATMYCQPEITFTSKEWMLNGKIVLEVHVDKSEIKPHRAPDTQGNYKVFIRSDDQNILASGIQIKVWKKITGDGPVAIVFNDQVKEAFRILQLLPEISIPDLKSHLGLSKHKTEELLSDLIVLKAVTMKNTENKIRFSLNDQQ